jgi:hypothetical protein
MSKKKEKRGRKALPPEQKKPPQPTIKINDFLYPFVKLLKHEYKAKRVDIDKLNALTRMLLEDDVIPDIEKQEHGKPEESGVTDEQSKATLTIDDDK